MMFKIGAKNLVTRNIFIHTSINIMPNIIWIRYIEKNKNLILDLLLTAKTNFVFT